VWTYEGRQVSNLRFQNLRPEFLNRRSISLSQDAVAILDRADPKAIRVCDAYKGTPIVPLASGKSHITHTSQVVKVALSQFSKGLGECRLAFIDHNRDLWLCPVV
ncbi:unnamed protein product, partial [Discosporangium mesarthrocarpum]